MKYVTILGAGQIGSVIASLLHQSDSYTVQLGDIDAQSLNRLSISNLVNTFVIDVTDEVEIVKRLEGQDCVVSACPYWLNSGIARAAAKAGVSYFDLTEDITTTNAVRSIAKTAPDGLLFAPQCGLAPGFIGILAHHLCSYFEQLDEVKLRVGALPQYPSNALMYNLTWSTRGLINEYCNSCDAIQNGQRVQGVPLEELENFSLNGISYETFNTSGGLGTLCETLAEKVRTLNYKTIRYPGHCDLIKFLLNDLRLNKRHDLLQEIFEHAIPITQQDVVISFCTITGWRDGRLEQVSDARKIYPLTLHGEPVSAIQISTAASLCAVLDMYLSGKISQTGFLKQEQVDLKHFLCNRFGRYYAEASEDISNSPKVQSNYKTSDIDINKKVATVA
ncbi:saccharopine dehydrogenase [Leptolyngbya sp. Heron Island J]|uniref:saccharopine dehydrogenase family protein n=1 Tax=Leptolyngbya sp. Heron Island J TaxID=1385935 RepID=UPI0003B97560|nr:saccharopine dehydrogenase C-terminal domain-containing protein [Leptolyngbya sp. Heron Island J]ESA32811.1 saccharopine dehydrogenase [Leptolyngbya sp. Heron Island J]